MAEPAQGLELGTRRGIEWSRIRDAAKGFWHPNNLDRTFPYKVPRTVTIQDARLGGSYLGVQMCIVLFIVLVQILLSGGHIAFESPFGQASFQTKRPTSSETPLSGGSSYWNLSDSSRTAAASGFMSTDQYPYCLNLTAPNRFCSTDPTNKSYYCKPMSCAKYVNNTYTNETFNSFGNFTGNITYNETDIVPSFSRCDAPVIPLQVLRCRYVDEESVAPIVEEKSMLVVSRVSWMVQDLVCEDPANDSTPCVHLWHPETSTNKYFPVAPEKFEIMFDHQVFTPTNGVEGKQEDFPDAPFVFQDGRTFYPASISPVGNGSFYRPDDKPWIPGYYNILGRHSISVETLLEAAGLNSLDTPCPGLFDAGSTYRYTGITVMLRIIYGNYNPWSLTTTDYPQYHYETELGSTYAAVHQVTTLSNGTRFFENRHGIKIVITQEGQLGKFTLVNFMFFMGGAVATLALASIVVDNLVMRFFIPKKVREIIDLASSSTVPVREDLNQYLKAVEQEMGTYEPPVTFWEVEKEWIEHGETQGKVKKRPDFKKTAASELQKLVEHEREARLAGGQDTKTETELVSEGALAFARSLSMAEPETNPDLYRTVSSVVRERWKIAKDGVFAQAHERLARMSNEASETALNVYDTADTVTMAPGQSYEMMPMGSSSSEHKVQSDSYQALE